MFAEPVMGGGGGLFAPKTYFEKIQRVLRKYDILFVADEVITGIGRTGNWWATQTFDLQPDIITSAKGLGAGMLPIGAAIINDRILQGHPHHERQAGRVRTGLDLLRKSHVHGGLARDPSRSSKRRSLIDNGRAIGRYFLEQVTGANDHPLFADVQSVGAVVSMEVMADREARKPFDPELNILGILNRHCNAERVLVRLNSNRIIFAPPLNMTMDEAAEAAARFRRAVDAAWKEVRAK